MKIELVATKAHTYGTRRLTAGDEFSAVGRDARVLVALGRATLAPTRPAVPPPPAPQAAPAQRRPRAYKRRDLAAQDVDPPDGPTASEPVLLAVPGSAPEAAPEPAPVETPPPPAASEPAAGEPAADSPTTDTYSE